MIFYAVGFILLWHVLFWGAGLAVFAMPKPWRRFWPILTVAAGFALQSTVVWIGAYLGLPGTNSYAWVSEIIPAVLLGLAIRRFGWRILWADVCRFGLVWLIMVGTFAALLLPIAIASPGLTTISLGSNDAPDYAAGARVFMEFAHADRQGFLGLTEVVRVMSVDNFFDFWLRLNHFTPSALLAINGTVLNCPPHELTSILTMFVMATTVPVVFWMARAVFGYSGAASLAISALFGISPIPWYSVAHVSPAPLIAAQAIGLLNWSAITLWQGQLTWRRGLQFGGVMTIGYALILGSYNFIVIVCIVPAIACAGVKTLCLHSWRRFARWQLIVLAPLAAAGVLFAARVEGLVERFMLFQTFDFGWKIPGLTPEGWLGLVQGGTLQPWVWAEARWLLSSVVIAALAWSIAVALWSRRRRVWIVASVTLPVLAGYSFLLLRGARAGTNASYDAFKLFTVFYPLLLPAFCWWITLRWSTRLVRWFAVAGVSMIVIGFNLVACVMFVVKLSHPPLVVGGQLRQLRKVEAMADVASINMLIPDMWPRLWANAFLLRKPQYFATHTYEGRLNTPLRGDWDLVTGILRVQFGQGGTRQITPNYALVDCRNPRFFRAQFDDGWYNLERLPGSDPWRWTRGDAALRIDNPQTHAVTIRVIIDGRGLAEQKVNLTVNGGQPTAPVAIGEKRQRTPLPRVVIPPGKSVLVLHSDKPAEIPPGDTRPLGFCVYSVTLQAVE